MTKGIHYLFSFFLRGADFSQRANRGGAHGGFLLAADDGGQPFGRVALPDTPDDLDRLLGLAPAPQVNCGLASASLRRLTLPESLTASKALAQGVLFTVHQRAGHERGFQRFGRHVVRGLG